MICAPDIIRRWNADKANLYDRLESVLKLLEGIDERLYSLEGRIREMEDRVL